MTAKRPIGFTILALSLWWVAFAGAVGAFVIPDSIVLRVISGAYGAAALVAGVAIWRQNSWAAIAFAAWSCIALATGVTFDVAMNLGPTLKGTVFVLAIGSVLWFIYRYVRRRAIVGA